MALVYLEKYRKTIIAEADTELIHESSRHGGHGPIQELLGSTAVASQAELNQAGGEWDASHSPE